MAFSLALAGTIILILHLLGLQPHPSFMRSYSNTRKTGALSSWPGPSACVEVESPLKLLSPLLTTFSSKSPSICCVHSISG